MGQPLVSILMCSFNREKYITEAIESVLESTYKNFELIIIDNCSEDRTPEIARSYELKDPRIKVFQNKTNIGQFPNRNKAAQLAKGKYLKYLDSDDKLYKDGLETMISAMEMHPEAGMGVSYYFKSVKIHEDELPRQLSQQEAYVNHYMHGGLLFPGPSFTIYRSDFFFLAKGFQQAYGVSADTHFNLVLAALAPIVVFKNNTTYWRIHPDQLSSNQKTYHLAIEKYLLDKEIVNHVNCPLPANVKGEILFTFKVLNARNLLFKHLLKFQISSFRKLNNVYSVRWTYFFLCVIPLKISKYFLH